MTALHFDILDKGTIAWNSWRKEQSDILPNLSKGTLSQTQPGFGSVNPEYSPKQYSNFDFSKTDFSASIIRGAKFDNCNFKNSNFYKSDLRKATFKNCDLTGSKFNLTNLTLSTFDNCDFKDTLFWETIIARTVFVNISTLNLIKHGGPSIIDHRTFQKSSEMPIEFLRGIGLTDDLIKFYNRKFSSANLVSCFISHSSKDKEFVVKLYDKLQNNGIRCWYAPKDLNYGDKIRDEIEGAIVEYDKLLIILSSNSIDSYWVEDEVEAAIEQEIDKAKNKLIPIALDQNVFNLSKPWFNKIKRTRHIGDFSDWRNENSFKAAVENLIAAMTK